MAGLACPSCGSQDFKRWRGPATVKDAIFRRHRCENCRGIFLSAQVAVSGFLAEKILRLTEQPTPGSALTPSPEAMSLRTLLEEWRDEDSHATGETQASSLTVRTDSLPATS